MKIKNNIKDREICPIGNHLAQCIRILDLGTQTHEKYGDKHKLQISWEIFDEEDSDGNHFVVYKNYTASLAPKASLTKDISSWLNIKIGKDDEIDLDDELLGQFCMINVIHSDESSDGSVYANVDSVSSVPKSVSTKGKKAENEIFSLYLDDTFDQEVFNSLPDFIQEKIAKSPEYQEASAPKKVQTKKKAVKK